MRTDVVFHAYFHPFFSCLTLCTVSIHSKRNVNQHIPYPLFPSAYSKGKKKIKKKKKDRHRNIKKIQPEIDFHAQLSQLEDVDIHCLCSLAAVFSYKVY